MLLLPTPLKGFTDAPPEIKTMLTTCAIYLYGCVCEHESVVAQAQSIRAGVMPDGYPECSPEQRRPNFLPAGTSPCTPGIVTEIRKRKMSLKRILADTSLTHFPRDEVRDVLSFWIVCL
jgi:hypothetical protein